MLREGEECQGRSMKPLQQQTRHGSALILQNISSAMCVFNRLECVLDLKHLSDFGKFTDLEWVVFVASMRKVRVECLKNAGR